jgi:hypothetical protein
MSIMKPLSKYPGIILPPWRIVTGRPPEGALLPFKVVILREVMAWIEV